MDKVVETVRHWRDELLNLSRRDRVLYYRPTKMASIEIEEPWSGEVLTRLLRNRRSGWRFFYPPDEATTEPYVEPAPPKAPREPDELLTQKPDRKSLEAALRTLDRRTTQEFMDKGIWVLYLAVGFLNWADPETGDRVRSPIALIPVNLMKASPRDPMRLVLAEEDAVVNPALAVRMESDFGVHMPDLPDLDEFDVRNFLEEIGELVRRRGWGVSSDSVIDVFSFHKEAMYRDLKENEKEVSENEVIRALALGAESDVHLSFEPPTEDELDERYPPEELATIRDADASQRRCIVASRAGDSFVMDGPPGTGKSQTISNIISQALHDGKTVLFVSEKIAALEVVKARLDEVGLGEYLLELHSHKATRREVAQTLYKSLSRYPHPKEILRSSDVSRVMSRRRELSAYAAAMNEVRHPLGMSLHRAIGRVSQLHSFPQAPLSTLLPSALDVETLNRTLGTAGELSRAWGPVERGDGFLWRGVSLDYASMGGKRAAVERIDLARQGLDALRNATTVIAQDLELWWNEAPNQAESLLRVLSELTARRDVPLLWLTVESIEPIAWRFRQRRAAAESHAEMVEKLSRIAGASWREVPAVAAEELTRSIGALADTSLGWPTADETDAGRIHDALRFAKATTGELRELRALGEDLATRLGIRSDDLTLTRCSALSEIASLVGIENQPEDDWLDEVTLVRVQEAANVLGSVVEKYRAKAEVLKQTFRPSVLNLDLQGLKVRFETVHTGIRKLGGAYRADKRLLAEHTLTGKANKAVIAALGDAVEWKEIAHQLGDEERRYGQRLGEHYYHGPDTRFDHVSEAIEVAARATELAGELLVDRARFRSQLGRGDRWDPDTKRVGDLLGRHGREWLSRADDHLSPSAESVSAIPLETLSNVIDQSIPHLTDAWGVASEVEHISGRTLTLGEVDEITAGRANIAEIEATFDSAQDEDRRSLGDRYVKLETDWEALADDLVWASKLRDALAGPVDQVTAGRLIEAEISPPRLEVAIKEWGESRDQVAGLFLGDRGHELVVELDSNYDEATDLLEGLHQSLGDIDEWSAYVKATNALAELGLADAIGFTVDQKLGSEQVSDVLERATLEAWIDWAIAEDSRLDRVRSTDRDAIVDEFRRLDQRMVASSAASVMTAVNARRPQTSLGPAGVISREGMKKTRHMPVRDLLRQTSAITQVIKPCFMMSPLSVSQFLSPDLRFDMVIFDEASQVRPSDAANCIYRGHQLIVAGDQKQLPPTDFFQRVSMDGDDEYDEDQIAVFESVLDLCKAGGMESLPLRWHYRSQHESLITYSNYSFYDGGLITFPGALDQAPDVGVELFHVPGTYRRGGARDNVMEAEKVAERVLFHARNHPKLTLGVVAFSEAQASTIEYVLDQKRRAHPELDDFFTEDRLSGFFVKNLENVQGDERDVMIFSVGYGPDELGKLTMNFGPLNRPQGWRRLNVAITRARRRVEVVTSIRPEDFQHTPNEGPRHLQRYLDFAIRGTPALAIDLTDSQSDAESPFEEEVLRVIRSWGYEARPQVGVASYRVDVGVVDPEAPGRYVLGVECDGAMYHSSKVARDRDRLRQQVLEGLDWTIHRIWGTAWYQDRQTEEERLRDAIGRAASGGRRRPPRPAGRPQVELVSADLEAAPAWAADYVVHRPVVPSYRDMQDPGSTPAIAEAIEAVVFVEGPVAKELVLRRVREAWGLGRAGSHVRAAFESGLVRARNLGVTKDRRNFLWTPDQVAAQQGEGVGVVRRPTDDPESQRNVNEVAPEERRSAIARLVGDARRVTWDELTSAVSALFGWNRRGSQIAEELDKDVRSLIRAGVLVREGDYLRRGDSV